jgi:8-oxo-dGTP pyrophosphatase MutT (NUDIX family)
MTFHYLVRGVIRSKGKILLVHSKDANNTFLPGGHIESGEKAELALIREVKEELGYDIKIDSFIGAVEHIWVENNNKHHEVNLVFDVNISEINADAVPKSLESHLEFIWAKPNEFKFHNLQPSSLIDCICNEKNKYNGYCGTW